MAHAVLAGGLDVLPPGGAVGAKAATQYGVIPDVGQGPLVAVVGHDGIALGQAVGVVEPVLALEAPDAVPIGAGREVVVHARARQDRGGAGDDGGQGLEHVRGDADHVLAVGGPLHLPLAQVQGLELAVAVEHAREVIDLGGVPSGDALVGLQRPGVGEGGPHVGDVLGLPVSHVGDVGQGVVVLEDAVHVLEVLGLPAQDARDPAELAVAGKHPRGVPDLGDVQVLAVEGGQLRVACLLHERDLAEPELAASLVGHGDGVKHQVVGPGRVRDEGDGGIGPVGKAGGREVEDGLPVRCRLVGVAVALGPVDLQAKASAIGAVLHPGREGVGLACREGEARGGRVAPSVPVSDGKVVRPLHGDEGVQLSPLGQVALVGREDLSVGKLRAGEPLAGVFGQDQLTLGGDGEDLVEGDDVDPGEVGGLLRNGDGLLVLGAQGQGPVGCGGGILVVDPPGPLVAGEASAQGLVVPGVEHGRAAGVAAQLVGGGKLGAPAPPGIGSRLAVKVGYSPAVGPVAASVPLAQDPAAVGRGPGGQGVIQAAARQDGLVVQKEGLEVLAAREDARDRGGRPHVPTRQVQAGQLGRAGRPHGKQVGEGLHLARVPGRDGLVGREGVVVLEDSGHVRDVGGVPGAHVGQGGQLGVVGKHARHAGRLGGRGRVEGEARAIQGDQVGIAVKPMGRALDDRGPVDYHGFDGGLTHARRRGRAGSQVPGQLGAGLGDELVGARVGADGEQARLGARAGVGPPGVGGVAGKVAADVVRVPGVSERPDQGVAVRGIAADQGRCVAEPGVVGQVPATGVVRANLQEVGACHHGAGAQGDLGQVVGPVRKHIGQVKAGAPCALPRGPHVPVAEVDLVQVPVAAEHVAHGGDLGGVPVANGRGVRQAVAGIEHLGQVLGARRLPARDSVQGLEGVRVAEHPVEVDAAGDVPVGQARQGGKADGGIEHLREVLCQAGVHGTAVELGQVVVVVEPVAGIEDGDVVAEDHAIGVGLHGDAVVAPGQAVGVGGILKLGLSLDDVVLAHGIAAIGLAGLHVVGVGGALVQADGQGARGGVVGPPGGLVGAQVAAGLAALPVVDRQAVCLAAGIAAGLGVALGQAVGQVVPEAAAELPATLGGLAGGDAHGIVVAAHEAGVVEDHVLAHRQGLQAGEAREHGSPAVGQAVGSRGRKAGQHAPSADVNGLDVGVPAEHAGEVGHVGDVPTRQVHGLEGRVAHEHAGHGGGTQGPPVLEVFQGGKGGGPVEHVVEVLDARHVPADQELQVGDLQAGGSLEDPGHVGDVAHRPVADATQGRELGVVGKDVLDGGHIGADPVLQARKGGQAGAGLEEGLQGRGGMGDLMALGVVEGGGQPLADDAREVDSRPVEGLDVLVARVLGPVGATRQ